MQINDVKPIDGKMCTQLVNLLRHGKWELNGTDIAAQGATVMWVQQLANQIAQSLGAAKKPDAPGGFTVKAAGPLPAPVKSNKPAKKKKK